MKSDLLYKYMGLSKHAKLLGAMKQLKCQGRLEATTPANLMHSTKICTLLGFYKGHHYSNLEIKQLLEVATFVVLAGVRILRFKHTLCNCLKPLRICQLQIPDLYSTSSGGSAQVQKVKILLALDLK